MRLAGKSAIVTGSARGIGKEIALSFAREGADVAVVDINLEGAQATAEAIRALGRRSIALRVDISDPMHVDRMVAETVAALGVPTVLVNDAIQARFGWVLELTPEDWDVMYNVGLKGYFLCSQRFARELVANKLPGAIISLSSGAAFKSNVRSSAYASIKAGVVALTGGMAVELARHNIRVNAIAPGVVRTELSAALVTTDTAWNERMARIPMHRGGTVQEIANVAVFLASDESSYVNGHTLVADGGLAIAGLMSE